VGYSHLEANREVGFYFFLKNFLQYRKIFAAAEYIAERPLAVANDRVSGDWSWFGLAPSRKQRSVFWFSLWLRSFCFVQKTFFNILTPFPGT
jgi:hypothetical protein